MVQANQGPEKGAEHADYRFSLEIQVFSLWRGAGEPLSFLDRQAHAAMAWPAISTVRHSFDPSYG
jgi:hypothetical protein